MADPTPYPALLGVRCDGPGDDGEGCGAGWRGDFLVHDQMTRAERLDCVLRHVAEHEGWQVVSADETYCPDCRTDRPTTTED